MLVMHLCIPGTYLREDQDGGGGGLAGESGNQTFCLIFILNTFYDSLKSKSINKQLKTQNI
jgi:hypothetical protein